MSRQVRCLLLGLALLLVSDGLRFVWSRDLPEREVRVAADGRVTSPRGMFVRPMLSRLVLASLRGRGELQAGLYTIRGRHSDRSILRYLANPRHREVVVTLPEGFRAAEMAERLEASGVVSARAFLEAATMRESYQVILKPSLEPVAGASLEGFLFPDTYRFFPDSNPELVVKKLLRRFRAVTDTTPFSSGTLTLASIVEREARADAERAVIAGIFTGRLTEGTPLEADPTVVYGRDTARLQGEPPRYRLWTAPTAAELTVDHPWNTYTRRGLPKTPISNPGLKSLEAARTPAKTSARFFFHDRSGNFVTSETLTEHTRKLRGE